MNYDTLGEDNVELNLKDMLAYVLLHWRHILLIAILVGIIAGGYKIYFVKYASQNTQNAIDKLQDSGDDYESRLQAAKGLQQAIDATNRQLEQKTKYMDNSILMHINPDKEAIATADIMLTVPWNNSENAIGVLVAAYQNRLQQGDYLDTLAKEMNTENNYLTELISITQVNTEKSSQKTIIFQNSGQVDNFIDSFTISVTGSTQTQADKILDTVLQEMNKITPELAQSIANHNLTIIHRYENTILNQDLMSQQVKTASDIATLQQSIENYQKNLKDINLVDNDQKLGSITLLEIFKVFIKWGVVAGLVMIFLGCAFYAVIYTLSGCLLTQEQTLVHYPVILLGAYRKAEEKVYRNNTIIDSWLRRIGNYECNNASWEDVLDMIIANLSIYAKDCHTIMLSSAADMTLSEKIQIELTKRIPNKIFILANQLEVNSKSRAKLVEVDGIVIVEKYGKTRFHQIDQELLIVKNAKKVVLGIIME